MSTRPAIASAAGSQVGAQKPFSLAIAGCVQFVVLTVVAMFLYPGGTVADPTAKGYQFFRNFFSDLGRTRTRLGEPNTVPAILFFVALTLAGLALVVFFAAMPRFFRRPRPVRAASLLGSVIGVIAGLSFAGIAFTPADVFLQAHGLFVQAAFLSFFVAVLLYIPAMLLARDYPNRYAAVFGGFALVLAAYLVLLFYGPSPASAQGLVIQATGQKIVVYAAIFASLIQARGARRLVASRFAQAS